MRYANAGVIEVGRELARAPRTGTRYVLAFIDLDGLKHTNDSRGHAGGARLRETARHEFLCGFGEAFGHGSVAAGVVEFRPRETLYQLVSRADNAMYAERGHSIRLIEATA